MKLLLKTNGHMKNLQYNTFLHSAIMVTCISELFQILPAVDCSLLVPDQISTAIIIQFSVTHLFKHNCVQWAWRGYPRIFFGQINGLLFLQIRWLPFILGMTTSYTATLFVYTSGTVPSYQQQC